KVCGPLNPATLLPDLPVLQDQHDCVEVVYSILQIRDNLFDVPLDNPDCILFSDGSSFYVDGKRFTGYAVTSEWDIQEAASLPGNWGAQAAELYALARACQLAAGKTVTIFTDSKYAFGVVQCHVHLWKFRGFQTAAGSPPYPLESLAVFPDRAAGRTDPPVQPGDFVWAKKFVRDDTLQPRFTGPHQVLLTTQTAVFLEGRKSWIHHSHVKPAVVDHSDGPAASATTEALPLTSGPAYLFQTSDLN
ncbi:hypothetical protein G0U57_011905, partial [Chelydra serpentina]